MSLLIEGMDMPKDCASCDLSRYYDGYNGGYGYSQSGWRCRRLKHIIEEAEETRPLDCPLSEIPTPHGRLIDADELTRYIEHAYGDRDIVKLVTNTIARQQTIVEAGE